jgi:hypothetical protein
MSNPVTSKLVGNYFSRLTSVLAQQSLKEPLCSLSISPLLQEHTNYFAILIYGSPQVVPLTLDLHEYLIDEKCITIP